jgi:hypothetical protein
MQLISFSFTYSLIRYPSFSSINTCFYTRLPLISDDEEASKVTSILITIEDKEASKVTNNILIIIYKLMQVCNLLSKSFILKRGLKAEKAHLEYFKTHTQHDLQVNPYLITKHLYLLTKCKLI